jgi:hypothetical protein
MRSPVSSTNEESTGESRRARAVGVHHVEGGSGTVVADEQAHHEQAGILRGSDNAFLTGGNACSTPPKGVTTDRGLKPPQPSLRLPSAPTVTLPQTLTSDNEEEQ